MSNNCNSLTEILRKIEPSELNEVSEISKKFNEFLANVLGNDFADGLMNSLDCLNFSDNKKDLIMTIFKIDPNYDLECLKALNEKAILDKYFEFGIRLNEDYKTLSIDEAYSSKYLYIPNIIKEFFSKLYLNACPYLESLEGLPGCLKELHLCKVPLKSLERLPEGLEGLIISWCNVLRSLEGLPVGLKELTIECCHKLKSLKGLPKGLEVLNIEEGCTNLVSLEGLPEGLREILINCDNFESLAGLPAGLEELIINCDNFESLEGLPAGLREMLINCPKLESLEGLPNGLKHLNLYKVPSKSLEGLPAGLKVLNIEEGCTNLVSLEGLPEDLEQLFINEKVYNQLDAYSKKIAQNINIFNICEV